MAGPYVCPLCDEWHLEGHMQRPAARPCVHLQEPTGDYVACGSCGGSKLPVHRCRIHGVTLLTKPVVKAGRGVWDGVNCVTCEQREAPP